MCSLLPLCSLVLLPIATTSQLGSVDDFASWLQAYDRQYASPAALASARANFETSSAAIATHNSRNFSWRLGHNAFSASSWRDRRACVFPRATGGGPDARGAAAPTGGLNRNGTADVPPSVDWVVKGAVTRVRDQGACGACWAFSTAAAVEGARFIATGALEALSVEELVQCATTTGGRPMGCGGGWLDDAFAWMRSRGIASRATYGPYTSANGTSGACRGTGSAAVFVAAFENITPHDEGALMAAVARGPVSVTVDADAAVFKHYAGGVIDERAACGSQQDHAVLVVGYGYDAALGVRYWKVKNSWGTGWGEEGYFRIARGKNVCAIEGQPAAPRV